ncbi:hypothetical protein PORY_000751 [Pneumocystis oryctolagi]|uniref:Uncharacterized protein n=1 Tax=Pneumocystis oryctolagi TaxID=42067 RepID=A0ACB7CDV7_9ASCO|nr:hypothetical protein PORY_000751 [Pneumocystis oryctolagi]
MHFQQKIEEVKNKIDDSKVSCNLWSSLLNSVSSVKKMPLKHLILLGGGNEGAREWIASLKRVAKSHNEQGTFTQEKESLTSSTYLMDYTYIEWMDPDHGERLAVIEVYLISEFHLMCETVLLDLLTPDFLKNSVVCVLLDWKSPWKWLYELHVWIQLLKKVIENFKSSSEIHAQVVSELVETWGYKIRTYCENSTLKHDDVDNNEQIIIPLGSGQYDEPIGLPLICVCNHSEHMVTIEKDEFLKGEHFDFIQQCLRTVLMKHGGMLCYTSDLYQHTLCNVLYSILDSFSLLSQIYTDIKSLPKANVIDRDQIFVPVGWDSWGKIRITRDGFDVEGISELWSQDLNSSSEKTDPGAIQMYENVILDYTKNDTFGISDTDKLMTIVPLQEFFLNQLNMTETKTQTQENMLKTKVSTADMSVTPTRLNLRGMNLDTDDVIEKLQKLRDIRSESNSPMLTQDKSYNASPNTKLLSEDQVQNEALANFFQSLLNRKKDT